MGCFSWKFADTNNRRRLKIGQPSLVACPDGMFIPDRSYNGYGHFGCEDIFDLVATWNREYAARNPDHRLHGGHTLSEYPWYEFYADLSLPEHKVIEKWHKKVGWDEKYRGADWRNIGITIACNDADNAALPFPIKICMGTKKSYAELPPSLGDERQGC